MDASARLLTRSLPGLAAAWADTSGPLGAEAAARRGLLRALTAALASRAAPDDPAVIAALALPLLTDAPAPASAAAARLAEIGADLAAWSSGDLAAALAELASAAAGPPLAHGAYATPSALADLMAGWAVRDGAAAVLDPACGAGALLARVAGWRAWRGAAADAPLWGIEADPAAAALARLALAGLGATGATVWTADFLALPPAEPGQVGAVVANPPFVRHERLPTDDGTRRRVGAAGGLSGRADLHAYFWPAFTDRLAPGGRAAIVTPASWLEADYGRPLRRYLADHYALEAIVEPAAERWFTRAGIHATLVLARRCDDPAERAALQTRLLRLHRPLTALLGPPGPTRWPAVAALVARLDALTADEDGPDWRVRLVAAEGQRGGGAEGPRGGGAEEQRSRGAEGRRSAGAQERRSAGAQERRSGGADEGRDQKPADALSAATADAGEHGSAPPPLLRSSAPPPLRPSAPPPLRPSAPPPLCSSAPPPLPWSAWLRAPAVLVGLLARWPGAWATLGEMARVRYPLKSGADGFFYMTAAAAAALGIAPEYVRPLARTPRELSGLVVEPAALNWRVLLLPPIAIGALPTAVQRYLAAGAAAGIDRRPTCAGRRPWYSLRPIASAPLLWPRFVHERHAVWLNPAGVLENQTFYGLLPADPALTSALGAVLNSGLGALVMEVCGRGSLGEGALQYAVAGAAAVPLPDVRRASPAEQAALTEALTALTAVPTWGPLGGLTPSPARLALDDLTLALLGLTDPAERTNLALSIRAALARLVAERQQRGRASDND